ncbi:condensation domain-containing protein [Streptomyces sp. GD-15H]|uniref:condensation domain-containing protein n=1 Tax=Streptomyces sp. GD-15H TaxID=3129112 RepID=UPI003255F020
MSATRSGPVTFGQLSVIRSLAVHGPERQAVANLVSVWEVPPGIGTAAVMDAWLRLVEAHESLRTTYDSPGERPVQIVHPFRPSRIPTVELAEDTSAAAQRATAEWAREPISIDTGPPWRAFVAEHQGDPLWFCTVIHHVAADNGALRILEAQFHELLAGRAPAAADQPLDMALAQLADPARIRQGVAHWTEVWDRLVPSDRDPTDTSERRRASLYSTAALASARELSQRLRISVQSVLLAIGALALSRLEGREQLTFALMAANRLGGPWASVVGSLNQYAPVTVTVDERTHPLKFLQDLYVQSLTAYLNGCYDVDVLKRSLREAGCRDEDPTAFAKHFNFLGEVDAEPEPRSLLRTGVEWRGSAQRSGPNFHLATAVGTGLLIGVGASRHCLADDAPALLAASIEAGIVNLAEGAHDSLRNLRLDPIRAV